MSAFYINNSRKAKLNLQRRPLEKCILNDPSQPCLTIICVPSVSSNEAADYHSSNEGLAIQFSAHWKRLQL